MPRAIGSGLGLILFCVLACVAGPSEALAASVQLDPISALLVGGPDTVTGAGFSAGSVVVLFVATATGAQAFGPFVPSTHTPSTLSFQIPASVPLGNGFASLYVVNTDQGFIQSNAQSALLLSAVGSGIPSITSVNGVSLATAVPGIPLAYANVTVAQGSTVTLGGHDFSNALVNLYTAVGNSGPLTPAAGATGTLLRVTVPANAPTGPAIFQVVDVPSFAVSNAVAAALGQPVTITNVVPNGQTGLGPSVVVVNGTGFSTLSLINLFNQQGTAVVNLGGLNPDGSARIPISLLGGSTAFSFTLPPAAVPGPAYVQILTPPFAPFSTSGADPDGAFTINASVTPTPPATGAPQMTFSTFIGGADEDTVRDVVADAQGNLYITGGSQSPDFPVTVGAYDTTQNGNMDVFVAKLDATGELVWSTFLGGPNYDRAYAIELDSQGNVIVAGRAGMGFPTTAGVVQRTFAGDTVPNALYGPQDGFIAKLSADGTRLLWSTYWGTDDACFIRDVAVDAADNVYPAGCAEHVSQYITPGAFQTTKPGKRDGLVAKLNAAATQVAWCTYVGGTADDAATPSIRVDTTGVYFVAATHSSDAPTTVGAYKRTLAGTGTTDMYVAKLAPDGASLSWGTYLGGAANEFSETHAVALDAQHNVYVAATTSSTDFPTTAGVVQPTYRGSGGVGSGAGTNYPGDGFVAKLSADGRQLLAGTYLGGSLGEGIEGVTVGSDGSVYVSGVTFSVNFPLTPDAFQTVNHGSGDAFALRLSADFRTILYSTYLGGTGPDEGRSSTVDSSGDFAIVGMTQADDWPRVHAWQTGRGGDWDGVVASIRFPAAATPTPTP